MVGSLGIVAVGVVAVIASTAVAPAQEMSIGQREYVNSCASCHGVSGKGDGALAGFLTRTIPDLTVLARNNGGVFPVSRIYEVIDGRAEVAAHGMRDMPVWGDEYDAQARAGRLGEFATGPDMDGFVRGRILALIEYVSTLQAE
ncbi:c-type cytochrome [Devosia sp.]|uniref:c-type cytochrome n=1 Tax=Devosia sp. TaxID=1871048 RepID=UPI002EF99603